MLTIVELVIRMVAELLRLEVQALLGDSFVVRASTNGNLSVGRLVQDVSVNGTCTCQSVSRSCPQDDGVTAFQLTNTA